jgi:hypothetical protein
VGGTGACAEGSQCCAGAADTDEQAFEQTYCIGDDPDFTCCPWDNNGLCDRDVCANCFGFPGDVAFSDFCCSEAETNDNGGCCPSYEIEAGSGRFAGGCCEETADCNGLPDTVFSNDWYCSGRCCTPTGF